MEQRQSHAGLCRSATKWYATCTINTSAHYLKIEHTRTGITLDTLASNRHNARSGFSIFKVPALRKKENKVQQYAWKEAAAVNNKAQQQREGRERRSTQRNNRRREQVEGGAIDTDTNKSTPATLSKSTRLPRRRRCKAFL